MIFTENSIVFFLKKTRQLCPKTQENHPKTQGNCSKSPVVFDTYFPPRGSTKWSLLWIACFWTWHNCENVIESRNMTLWWVLVNMCVHVGHVGLYVGLICYTAFGGFVSISAHSIENIFISKRSTDFRENLRKY